jgi:hypothetical protein
MRSGHEEWVSESLSIEPGEIVDAAALRWCDAIDSDGPEWPLDSLLTTTSLSVGTWCGSSMWSGMVGVGASDVAPVLPPSPGRPQMETVAGLPPDLLVSGLIRIHHLDPDREQEQTRRFPDAVASPIPWDEATAHADRVSQQEGLPRCYAESIPPERCLGYRLPTDTEWEALFDASTRGDFRFLRSEWEWTNTVGEHWAMAYERLPSGYASGGADRHFRGHDGPYTHEKDVGFRLVRRWPRCAPGTWDVTCRPAD